ncbi:MAG: Ca-activated chloride channel family protein [Luteibaculaceae bacterium]|jgi:Ca-activated chloride channel family protein
MNKNKIANISFALVVNLLVFTCWRFGAYIYEFKHPGFFWLLLVIPAYSAWYVSKNGAFQSEISYTGNFILKNIVKRDIYEYIRHFRFVLQLVGLGLLIIAMARPQSRLSWNNVETEGIDIVLAMDVSASMLAQDFKPDRLESSKKVASEFIDGRKNDRIGLVVYEGESFTQCPLTTDHEIVKTQLSQIETGILDGGTAIGMGLATGINRLKESEAKSKVMILLTDGVNNRGMIEPMTAADIAKTMGIKVYTIGVGTKGKALSPVAIYPNGKYKYDMVDVEIDELTLQKIAYATGGKYYRATSEQKLSKIYEEIDRLEKTKIEVTEFSQMNEEFFWFCLIGLLLLLSERLLKTAVLQNIP